MIVFKILNNTVYVLGVLISKSVDVVSNVQIKFEESKGEVTKLVLNKYSI